jgi:2-alkyl-3-oxoalkanoate reductase
MKIFITGATGYIGSNLANALSKRGHTIMALARSEDSANQLRSLNYEVIRGNVAHPDEWIGLASRAEILVHVAQLRIGKRVGHGWVKKALLADTLALQGLTAAAKLNPSTKAIFYTSGISVVGDHASEWVDESTQPLPGKTIGSYHLETERRIKERVADGYPFVIIRSSLPVSAAGTFASFFLEQARKGKLQYAGTGNNFWPTIHMDDLIEGYCMAIEKPPVGETLILSDDNPVTMKEFSEQLMNAFGHTKTKSASKWLVSLFAGEPLANLLVSSYRVRNDKAKRILGWQPRYRTFRESLQQVIARN